MAQPLNETQINELLNKVNINNTFLEMGLKDQELITVMKDTILYQTQLG